MEELEQYGELLRGASEADLYTYSAQAWPWLEPSRPWRGTWYRQAIAEHLQCAWRGEFRRLVITVPPQTGKSSIVAKLFPTWCWTHSPKTRLLFASYSFEGLAVPMSVERRRLIESEWYQTNWGSVFQMSEDDNLKWRFSNSKGGHMTVLTGATGIGGDILLVDDLHSAEEALSDIDRTNGVTRFRKALMTRLTPGGGDTVIVICQRLHELDLPGELLREGGWAHLDLPSEILEGEKTRTILLPLQKKPENRTRKMQPGEVLDPVNMSRQFLDRKRIELGEEGYAGQYLQVPAPPGGLIFKPQWWGRFSEPPEVDVRAISVDAAFKENRDAVAIQSWGFRGPNAYLMGRDTRPRGYIATKEGIRGMASIHRPNVLLIEEAANGAAIAEELRKEYPVLSIPVKDSKTSRAQACAPQVQAGCVHIPVGPEGDRFIIDAAKFPRGANDHDVDAMTLALLWRMQNNLWIIEYYRERAAELPPPEAADRQMRVNQFEISANASFTRRPAASIRVCSNCNLSRFNRIVCGDMVTLKCRNCGKEEYDNGNAEMARDSASQGADPANPLRQAQSAMSLLR